MVEEFLGKLKYEYTNVLGSNLVGIYLHGSIVFNCFNPEKSDMDFIVVVDRQLDYEAKKQLIEILVKMSGLAPKKGFEMSVVLNKHCLNFEYPTPYELHFSNSWSDKYLENPKSVCNDDFKTDPDLAAHFVVIKNYGKVLYGKAINDVFGEVKKEYYIDSIYNDIVNAKEDIINDPTYITLNLCRVLAYLEDDKILSKEQGGSWGLENLNEKYNHIIRNAKNNLDVGITDEDKIEFAEYMLNNINKFRNSWK